MDLNVHDEELLKLQKRKSIPSVVIQEFVGEDDAHADEDCEDPDAKVKTHHRIDDVSILFIFCISLSYPVKFITILKYMYILHFSSDR